MKELQYPFDPEYLIRKKKSIRRKLTEDGSARLPKKIAVLGGSTTDDILKMLELFLLDQGIEPSFYQCEYAQFEQEALFPGQEFLEFGPDLIYIHTSNRNIRRYPEMTDSREDVEAKLQEEAARFRSIWDHLADTFHCPIIQNNMEMPFYRILGNRDSSDFRGRTRFITRLNEVFYAYADEHENFRIHDLNYLSADYGLKEWSNPSVWNLYKYCLSFKAIPHLAFSVSNMIKAIFGKNKKALALDLDNTLWGGVVGDDGVDGIEIGQENGTSQSYHEFQQYLKQVKAIGIPLTVCSKNDEENAMEGLRHPEGPLKPDDFAVIKANWNNKDRNIAEIAGELNILPEAIVFVDDNPAERAIVEAQLPGVCAPLMDAVENYIINLDRSGFFEMVSLTEDDLKRSDM
ncbi:MAG: HAD-IIIC family phosphatase, partial [Eubacterium sp.]|nr:HAD-IIIC family phosphatase [Eubacterium sp.]